jgi:hypothetical protein
LKKEGMLDKEATSYNDIFDAVRLVMKMFTSDKRMIIVEHGHLSIVFESNESQYILMKENPF